jgi:hypothetical protein
LVDKDALAVGVDARPPSPPSHLAVAALAGQAREAWQREQGWRPGRREALLSSTAGMDRCRSVFLAADVLNPAAIK